MKYPNLNEEKKLWRKGYKYVVCLDEAGRGALAGPVVAAGVIINSKFKMQNLSDSKKLRPKAREKFYKVLTTHSGIKWGIGKASEKVIDKINILEATKLAMEKAIKNLEKKLQKFLVAKKSDRFFQRQNSGGYHSIDFKSYHSVDFLILDGNFIINLPIPQRSIVKADEKVFSCAVASIIAKVTRDRIMERYHKKYPQYGFDKHKGYPTKLHLKMLKKYGPSKIHRKSFGPVRNL